MEEEAEKLKEMQSQVDKQMMSPKTAGETWWMSYTSSSIYTYKGERACVHACVCVTLLSSRF